MAKYADGLSGPGLGLLGLVLMVVPLALWVAWSETLLLVVLAAGVAAAGLYCVLARLEKPADPTPGAEPVRRAALPARVIGELQRLHPFVYHNRLSAVAGFRRAMDRLRMHLDRGAD